MRTEEQQEEIRRARKKAMNLLERMDRTEKGLLERLRQAGFSPEAAQDALDYVKDYGYIDDARYARNYITWRIHEKSRQRIFQELKQKGVDSGTIAAAWDAAAELEEPDERAVLLRTVEKKYPPGAELDERQMRRLYGYLARRGFHAGDIASVLEELDIKFIKM